MSDQTYAVVQDDVFAPLVEAASPELFRLNAFRVLGVSTRATERDLKKQSDKLQMMDKYGDVAQTQGPLPLDPPPERETIQEAIQRAREPEQRLIDELFWFWPQDSRSDMRSDPALMALTQRDLRTAINTWAGQLATDQRGIAAHNLAVLYLTSAIDAEFIGDPSQLSDQVKALRHSYWREAFTQWRALLNNEGFWKSMEARITELDDPRLTVFLAQQIRATLPLTLLSINVHLAVAATEEKRISEVERHRDLIQLSGFPPEVIEEATRRGVAPLRAQLKMICDTAEKEGQDDPPQANAVARNLVEDARPILVAVDSLLPAGHSVRDDARDEVATATWRCGILYGNKTSDWQTCLELLELARPYATSVSLREKIAEGLETVKQNIESKEFSKCWFCKEVEGEDACTCEVPMYGNVVRTRIYNGTRVTWEKLKIKVPRCGRCKKAHSRNSNFKGLGFLFGAIAGGFLAILTFAAMGGPDAMDGVTFFGLAFLLIAAIIIAMNVAKTLCRISTPKIVQPLGVKVVHPTVLQMGREGWKVGTNP